ncbi:MAG TPA: tetratricopeptide repeat protein, partial [Planctomycetaceae bacterium]|nr:tetratricopeptide repeat protein [Planctomycetaceae bacterium]
STARNFALSKLASSRFDQGRYDQARVHLEELVKIERTEISLMLLGICHEHSGNLPEAVRLVNAAILDSPYRADLHRHLAELYRRMGKSDDAVRQLQLSELLRSKVPQPN